LTVPVRYAGARVDGDTAELSVDLFAFAGMDARTHVETELLDSGRDRRRGPERLGGLGERRKEAVAGRVLLSPSEAPQRAADDPSEPGQHLAPARVAELPCHAVEPTMSTMTTVATRRRGDSGTDRLSPRAAALG
jgi:hypothetical protein